MKMSDLTDLLDQFFTANPNNSRLKKYFFLYSQFQNATPTDRLGLIEELFSRNGKEAGGNYKEKDTLDKIDSVLRKIRDQLAAQKKAVTKIDSYLANDKKYQEYDFGNAKTALPRKYLRLNVLKNTLETSFVESYDFSDLESHTNLQELIKEIRNILDLSEVKNTWDDDLKIISAKYNFNPVTTPAEEIAKIIYDNRLEYVMSVFCERNKNYLMHLATANMTAATQILQSSNLTKNFTEEDIATLIQQYYPSIQKSAAQLNQYDTNYNYDKEVAAIVTTISSILNEKALKLLKSALAGENPTLKTISSQSSMFGEALKVLTPEIKKATPGAEKQAPKQEPKREQPKPNFFKPPTEEEEKKNPLHETVNLKHLDEQKIRLENSLIKEAKKFAQANIDIYSMLGLQKKDNSAEEIDRAHRKKALEYKKSNKEITELNQIKEILLNENARKAFDIALAVRRPGWR